MRNLVTEEARDRGPVGARGLLLLTVPLHVHLLTALEEGPSSLAALRGAGAPPPTTMRGYLRALALAKVIEKRREPGFPGAVDYRLTAAGHDLVKVAEMLSSWLTSSPNGRYPLGTATAKRATKAVIEAWASGIVSALTSRPCSLTELDGAIAGLSYPALERRLSALRRFGLVEAVSASGRGTPFAASEWLRVANEPLQAAARWELRWLTTSPGEETASPLAPAPTR